MNKADEFSQAQKRKILAEDRARLATYHAVAQGSIEDDRGGRFAVQRPTTVVGASPIQYPRLPLNSPANQAAMTGPEPPLGFSVNDQEPVGEPFERGDTAAPEVPSDGGLRLRGWRRL
jgi:hypothetical protein